MSYCTIDKSNDFVTIIQIHSIFPSDDDINNYLKMLEPLLQENRSWLFDLRQAKFLSSDARIKVGKWLKANEKTIKANIPGFYYVVGSKVIEAVLTCIFLVSKPPTTYAVGSKIEMGVQWGQSQYKSIKNP